MPFDKPTISRRKTLGLLAAASLLPNMPANAAAGPDLPTISNGINIPLWMDQPDGSASPPSDNVLALLSQFGFSHIRLPIDPDRFALGGVESRNASAELTQITAKLIDFGFSVTFDMHPQGSIATALKTQGQGETALDTAWKNIASVAKDFPSQNVFLEILNEPQMWRDRWIPLRNSLAQTIRAICPDHTIIWGANKYQTISETISCPPLADENAITAIHFYAPLAFTHQCQNWGKPQNPALRDLPFPADLNSPQIISALAKMDSSTADGLTTQFGEGWNISQINNAFSRLNTWASNTGTKVILNEFGTLKFCADNLSRAIWTQGVRQAAENNNIGWTYWEFDRGFGFMGSRTSVADVDMDLVAALTGDPDNLGRDG